MFSVAIDGPAGAGKSTLAKKLAKKLGFIYVDTGALYRAIGYYVLLNGGDPDDDASVINFLKDIDVKIKFKDGSQIVMLNGKDVSENIRTQEISTVASKVSAIPQVRSFLLSLQRDMAKYNNVIMDGRDIATVILPNADVKIYLTASPEVRAQRRLLEFQQKGIQVNFEDVLKTIKERDYNDSHRKEAPLRVADGAIIVDTDKLDARQTLDKIFLIVKEKFI